MNIYIFIVIILILLYININYNRENYVSNLVPIKSISSHFCDKPLDIITDNETRKNIGNFCKTHPTITYFDKISTLIIPDKTMINKKQIKILNTKNLKILKLFSNTYNENIFNAGKLLREQNLMKLEALSLCSNDALCEAVSIGKNINNIGKAKFWTNGSDTINTQKRTIYSKKYNYEYSIVFWIKINNLNRNWRNIFHHGNINKHRFPGIWIKPNSAGILFAISTTEKNTDTYGESVSIGNVSLNKWHHIAITVKDKMVTTYLDGSPNSKLDLIGDILWPYNEKVYIADPWHATGNFELLNFDFQGFNTMFLRFFACIFCSQLSGVRCGFPRALKAHGTSRRPCNCIALNIRDENLGVVERAVNVSNAGGDVLALFFLRTSLIACH